MKITCGIYLYSLLQRKILLCHPTRSRWNNWSIPKGLPEDGEDHLACAIRELKEETGIDLSTLHVVRSFALPRRRYSKQDKALESFLVVTDTDLTKHNFTSNLVEGKGFPENDKWEWKSIEECGVLVHESQRENLETIGGLVKQE